MVGENTGREGAFEMGVVEDEDLIRSFFGEGSGVFVERVGPGGLSPKASGIIEGNGDWFDGALFFRGDELDDKAGREGE